MEGGLPMFNCLLQHTLKSLCSSSHSSDPSKWAYAVFWRILPRNFPPPKWEYGGGALDLIKGNKRNWILVWEDGYCDFDECERAAESGFVKGRFGADIFFKMCHEVYNYGEGLLGKVAADNNHRWVFRGSAKDEPGCFSSWKVSIDPQPKAWEIQFKTGIQTIALIPVKEGMIQLGSFDKVTEDPKLVDSTTNIRDKTMGRLFMCIWVMELSEPRRITDVQKKQACSIKRARVLLVACGSVDAIKFSNLCLSFSEWADVKAVATQPALFFIDKESIPNDVTLYTDADEWSSRERLGDTVLHIQLSTWADVMVIAPLSANTLGKIAGGVCDNLVTSIARAWDYTKPVFVAPSMNTFMWKNPYTEKHLMMLDEMGINLIPPVHKRLASGEYGNGAMADPSHINMTVKLLFESRCPQPAAG